MTGEPVRVLRVITRLNAGGPARHVVWLSSGLRDRGYGTLLVAGHPAPGESDLSAFASERGVPVRTLPDISREISPREDAAALRSLLRIIEEFDPHVVHTHTSKAGLLGRAAARLANARRSRDRRIRIVHTFHGNVLSGYFSSLKSAFFRGLERELARFASDALVVLSPQQRSEIVERFRIAPPGKVHVVPLALDLGAFDRLPPRGAFRRELGIPEGSFLVGIVGRIAPVKNHELFLRAAARHHRTFPDTAFVVVGDGEGLEGLRRIAWETGLVEAVRFAGLRTDLPQIYSDLDAVALTSRNEGTPLSLIEAMASGRPVVATAVGGVEDLLTREWEGGLGAHRFFESPAPRGLLVPSGDEDGFAAALERLARDAELRRTLGEAGRTYALRLHGLPRLLEDVDRLYRTLP